VIVQPGRPWFAAEPPGPHLRLTYAAAAPQQMDEACRRLARAVLSLSA
jgi:DNA-binding transcriptional MocR family regulator